MASMTIKDIGSIMSRNALSGVGSTGQQTGAVSFESIWNNQTEKNDSSELVADQTKNVREEETPIRDSLKAKETRKSTVKDADEVQAKELKDMDSEDWEKAMEVLGATATEMIQRIADTFDMTTEEVQDLMADLGMEQLDVLNQENLGELILAAAGVDNATALLTDGELYQNYQALMEQMNALMEQCSEELQMPMETVEEILDTESLPIEVTVEDDVPAEESLTNDKMNSTEEGQNLSEDTNSVAKTQSGEQTQNQTEGQMNSGKEADDKGQNGNLLLQNLKAQNFEPQLQQISNPVSAWDADTLNIMKQIMDYMKIQVKPDMSSLEMQLHPESLGTLQVNVASKGGTVTAQFVTQNEAVKAVLESQMIQLKENFAEQGVKVDAIEVTVQTHQFEQNLEQGRGGQQAESDRKSRTRRIQLDGDLTMEELDNMEEEEQLAAEMMAANGNTVDYTV